MQDHASYTSFQVLAARAIYSIAPKNQLLIDDPYAEFLLPTKFAHLRFTLKYLKRVPFLYNSLHYLSVFYSRVGLSCIGLRHRYIDACLQRAYSAGIRQVVILGAGFDSRAHRMHYPDLHFIEVDHPQTQKEKRLRLAKLKLPINDKVSYVAVDFMCDWLQTIKASGVLQQQATLFIWEGVSYYLNQTSIEYTLKALRELVNDKVSLVFDALPQAITDPLTSNKEIRYVQKNVTALGEPMLWGCDKEKIGTFLAAHAYTTQKVLTLADYAAQLRRENNMQIEHKSWQDTMYLVEASSNH